MQSFLVFVVGTTIIIRTFFHFTRRFSLSNVKTNHLYIVLIACLATHTLIFKDHPLALWLSFGMFFILLKVFDKNFSKIMDVLFSQKQIILIDQIIFAIRGGKSLRSAVAEVAQQNRGWLKLQLREILSVLEHGIELNNTSKGRVVADFTKTLAHIDSKKTHQLDSLNLYRNKLKTRENFRRRSGKIKGQIYAQTVIMSCLLVVMSGFGVYQFGWNAMKSILPLAVTFFVAGVFCMIRIGRGIKWKL
ncbi:MAG: hypothetical protein ACLGGX_00970 [Bdellovibrionia bacterium]